MLCKVFYVDYDYSAQKCFLQYMASYQMSRYYHKKLIFGVRFQFCSCHSVRHKKQALSWTIHRKDGVWYSWNIVDLAFQNYFLGLVKKHRKSWYITNLYQNHFISFDVSSQLDIYDTRFFVTMQHSEQQACKIKYTMSCNLKTFP